MRLLLDGGRGGVFEVGDEEVLDGFVLSRQASWSEVSLDYAFTSFLMQELGGAPADDEEFSRVYGALWDATRFPRRRTHVVAVAGGVL
jgi:hypothetical protein